MELFSLQGQTALVTGAAKGIGKGIATVLRRAGAEVIIADIDREHGEATAAVLGGHYQPLRSPALARWTSSAPTPASFRKKHSLK